MLVSFFNLVLRSFVYRCRSYPLNFSLQKYSHSNLLSKFLSQQVFKNIYKFVTPLSLSSQASS